jgi:multidrug efflux pump subunit AcrA (membrane-fusion protein)
MTRHLLVAVLGCAALVSSTDCGTPEPRATDTSSPMVVTMVTAATRDVVETFDAGGVVRARAVAAVTSRIMAEVRSVAVKPGDRVRAGQVLVVLDGRDLEANRARAAAAESAARQSGTVADADRQAALAMLSLAQVSHGRIADLKAVNSATQGELDQAVAALRSAEARVRAAEARISASNAEIDAAAAATAAASAVASYATLSAPFDGLVTEKAVEAGVMVAPGQSVLTVEDTRAFRLEVRLDESRAALVRVGDLASVLLDTAGGSHGADATRDVMVAGTVSEVSRMLSAESHDFLIKIDMPSAGQLRSGMYGKARFRGPTHRALAVQPTALVRRGQLAFVYVVERDNRAHLRLVNAGEAVDGVIEIRSGLLEGDRVVSAPPPALVDGSPVRTETR